MNLPDVLKRTNTRYDDRSEGVEHDLLLMMFSGRPHASRERERDSFSQHSDRIWLWSVIFSLSLCKVLLTEFGVTDAKVDLAYQFLMMYFTDICHRHWKYKKKYSCTC